MKVAGTIFILLITFSKGFTQGGDGGSGWNQFWQNAAHFAWTKGETVKAQTTAGNILANTVMMVNKMQHAADMTGTLVATGKDLKNMTEQFQKDYRSIGDLGKLGAEEVNKLIGFSDALKGQGYQPIFSFSEAYDRNTATFRDGSGQINVGGALMTSISDQEYLRKMNDYSNQQLQFRRINMMTHDMQIRQNIRMLEYYANQRRIFQGKLNIAVFANAAAGLAAGKDSQGTRLVSEADVENLQDAISTCLEKENALRASINSKLDILNALQKGSITTSQDFVNYSYLERNGMGAHTYKRFYSNWNPDIDEVPIDGAGIIIDDAVIIDW